MKHSISTRSCFEGGGGCEGIGSGKRRVCGRKVCIAVIAVVYFILQMILVRQAHVANQTSTTPQKQQPQQQQDLQSFEAFLKSSSTKSSSATVNQTAHVLPLPLRATRTNNLEGSSPTTSITSSSNNNKNPDIDHRTVQSTKRQKTNTFTTRLSHLPSVDFFSCCGLGHRMTRLSDAYNIAKQFNFTFRAFFGFCGHQEIFSYFFSGTTGRGDEDNSIFWTSQEMLDMTSGLTSTSMNNMYLKINNEAPHFRKLVREGPSRGGGEGQNHSTTCKCYESRFESDIEIFTKLRDRFRGRDNIIQAFRDKHFADGTVIGLHVRAGNGEKGQFERKNRTIANIEEWTASMTRQLLSIKSEIESTNQPPPILFIATDTVSIISEFRALLGNYIPVVDLSQTRTDHGQGVLFGERGSVTKEGDKCIDGWEAVISDMMLLSYADVLIAGRPSSLTQSLPMTMVLSTPVSDRKVRRSFCEVDPSATERVCYESLMDWCCNGNTSFSLRTIQGYDYRKFAEVEVLDLAMYYDKVKMRPADAETSGCWPSPSITTDCLPMEMPDPERVSTLDKRRAEKIRLRKQKRQSFSLSDRDPL
jgi:hypothetical protein